MPLEQEVAMNYNYGYDYMYGSGLDAIATGILAIYLIALIVFLVFYIVSYVLKGIGMYTIAKRQGRDYPWLAFIPFARKYLQGELAGSVTLKNKTIKNPGIWLLALPFIFGAVNLVFYLIAAVVGIGAIGSLMNMSYGYGYYGSSGISIGMIMGIVIAAIIWIIVAVVYQAVYKVLGILVDHQIFAQFTSKNMSIAHAVLSGTIPLYESICLFVMRNRDFNPGMGPRVENPFIQPGSDAAGTATWGGQVPPAEPVSADSPKAAEETTEPIAAQVTEEIGSEVTAEVENQEEIQ